MGEEKIANRQLWFILFLMRTTIFIAFLPVITVADTLQNAWISVIIVLGGSLLIVILFSLLDIRFPELTVIEYSQLLLGKWMGKLISIIFLWIFLQLTVVEIRLYAEVTVTAFLNQTPSIVIISGMVLSATICVYMGIETLGKTADFIFIIFGLMIAVLIFFPFLNINPDNYQPVLNRGWLPVIKGALTPIFLMMQISVLGMLSPDSVEPEKTLKTAISAITVSIIVLEILVLLVIGVLGAETAARTNFPLLQLMRSIEFSQFLQRIEILLIFSWGFGLFISVATYLYCGARGISKLTGVKNYRSLAWPMSIIWIFLSLQGFEDIFTIKSFLQPEIFVQYSFLIFIIPLFLLWIGYGLRLLKGE